REFDSNRKLVAEFNRFFTPYKYDAFKELDAYPDSIFYYYDGCENCNRTTNFYKGRKRDAIYKYFYTDFDNGRFNSVTIEQIGNENAKEVFRFNDNNQIVGINTSTEEVQIEYANNKIARYVKIRSTLTGYE